MRQKIEHSDAASSANSSANYMTSSKKLWVDVVCHNCGHAFKTQYHIFNAWPRWKKERGPKCHDCYKRDKLDVLLAAAAIAKRKRVINAKARGEGLLGLVRTK